MNQIGLVSVDDEKPEEQSSNNLINTLLLTVANV